jgi:hypothetical protein
MKIKNIVLLFVGPEFQLAAADGPGVLRLVSIGKRNDQS